jgi:hypothetical protein
MHLLLKNLRGIHHKSPGIYQIVAELIQAEDNILRYEIHEINYFRNTEELPLQWKEFIKELIYRNCDVTSVITEDCRCH